ncbi:fas-binding factor 1 homolog [Caloenas nicobarica]|uniref:fas-binding factor 1 homolog n=1 Tax=Caloenas nicobarica TaxID=187106 RepID=UPI0032B84DA4
MEPGQSVDVSKDLRSPPGADSGGICEETILSKGKPGSCHGYASQEKHKWGKRQERGVGVQCETGFQDKDDADWDFLGTSKPSSGPWKMPVKRGTESSSETTPEQSSRKELPPRQTPLRTVAPVQRRKTSTFEDVDDDNLLDAMGIGNGPKKENHLPPCPHREELRPARSKLDELFGRGSVAKVLEKPGTGEHREFKLDKKLPKQPEEEKRWDKEELVFGAYKPSMGSRPAVQPATGQSVRFSAEISGSEPNPELRSTPRRPGRRNPVQRRRGGDDWLGLEDDDFLDPDPLSPAKGSPALSIPSPAAAGRPSPASQLGAAEEAAAKPDPMDWLTAALARRKAEAQAEVQKIEAKTMETQEKKVEPSETQEKKAEPSEAQEKKAEPSEAQEKKAEPSEAQEKKTKPLETQDTKAEPSEAQDTKAEPSETAGEGPGPCSPVSQLAASPAASECRAELLSAQARVAELESQVRMLEEERAHHKLLLESAQQQHREYLDLQKSSHRTSVTLLEENYGQRVEMLRQQNEQLVAQLRQQWQDTARDRAELLAQHRLDLEELREQHRLELQRLRELQRGSVQELRKKHEEQLQHVKWLKEQEMDVLTSTTSHTRSLDGIIEKMEKFSSDLQNMCKRDMEEERSRVQELVTNTEARLGEQTRLLEQRLAGRRVGPAHQGDVQRCLLVTGMSLGVERAELKMQGQELKAKEEQLARDRQRLDEAWQELRLEKEKVNQAVLRVQQQEELMRNSKQLLAQKHTEGERALGEARRMESQFRNKLQVLQQQQEHLKQQQEHLKQQQEHLKQQQEQQKQEQQRLDQERASLASMYSTQVELLKFQAQQEDKRLEEERNFLESLRKARYNTSRLSTTPPPSSSSVDDDIEYTRSFMKALRNASPPVQPSEEKWNGLFQVLLPAFTAVKIIEQPAWIQYSRVKKAADKKQTSEPERAELKMQGQELKAKEEQLARDRQRLDEAWQELRLEKKVNGAALRVQQQEELTRSANELLAQKHAEGERALGGAHRMESQFRDKLQVLQQQQEQLKQQEQTAQQRLSTAHQRRRREQPHEELPNHPVTPLTTAQDLGAPTDGLSSTLAFLPPTRTLPRHSPRDIGESLPVADNPVLSAQVQLLKFQAQWEDDYLEREKIFLESLKKARYNTSCLSASRPSFCPSPDHDFFEVTQLFLEILRKAPYCTSPLRASRPSSLLLTTIS